MLKDTANLEEQLKRRKEVFRKLDGKYNLPSPSGTVMEVIRLCNTDTSSLFELAEIIQTDPALSAEILQYANSAFLSTGIQVASVQKATVKLGIKTVVVLALGFSLLAKNKSGTCNMFDYPLFWRKSLAKAIASREIAKLNSGLNSDELFVCGLLSNMGTLSLATIFPDEYGDLLQNKKFSFESKLLEAEAFGIDSDELTSELFIIWGLPVQFGIAAGFHSDLDYIELGKGETFRIAVILSIADTISQMCQSSSSQPELLDIVLETSRKFKIELGVFNETFRNIVENWYEQGGLFKIETAPCYLYDE